MALIRGSSLTGFNELVAERGHDPESVLRRSGIRPQDVWSEMDRREQLLGIAEKPPKTLSLEPVPVAAAGRRKVVALEARRIPKRRRSGY